MIYRLLLVDEEASALFGYGEKRKGINAGYKLHPNILRANKSVYEGSGVLYC